MKLSAVRTAEPPRYPRFQDYWNLSSRLVLGGMVLGGALLAGCGSRPDPVESSAVEPTVAEPTAVEPDAAEPESLRLVLGTVGPETRRPAPPPLPKKD